MHYNYMFKIFLFLLSIFIQATVVNLQNTTENVKNELEIRSIISNPADVGAIKNEIPENSPDTAVETQEISSSRAINETIPYSNNVTTEKPKKPKVKVIRKVAAKSSKLTENSKMANLTTKTPKTSPSLTLTSVTSEMKKKRKRKTNLTTTTKTTTKPTITRKKFNKEMWLQMKKNKRRIIKSTTGKPTTQTISKIIPTTEPTHKLFNFKLAFHTTTCTTTISPSGNSHSENFGTKNSTIANGMGYIGGSSGLNSGGTDTDSENEKNKNTLDDSLKSDKNKNENSAKLDSNNSNGDKNSLKNKYLLKATTSSPLLARRFEKLTTTTTALPTIPDPGIFNFPKALESCGSKNCDNSLGFICVIYDLPCFMREEQCPNYEDSSDCIDSNSCAYIPCDTGLQCMMLKSPCDFRAHHLRGCPPMRACIDPQKSHYCGGQKCEMRHGQICEIKKVPICPSLPCPDLEICREMIDIRARKRSA